MTCLLILSSLSTHLERPGVMSLQFRPENQLASKPDDASVRYRLGSRLAGVPHKLVVAEDSQTQNTHTDTHLARQIAGQGVDIMERQPK